jgi:hypothetical protein
MGAIWLGSAADQAGMTPGDQLVKIGALDTSADDFATLCDMSDVVGLFGINTTPVSATWIHDGEQKASLFARTPLLSKNGDDDS